MKKFCLMLCFIALIDVVQAQDRSVKLKNAVQQLVLDSQMRHAILSFTVVDAASGRELFSIHPEIGLAPASTQKLFTAIAAFDLLGSDYRYHTNFSIQSAPSSTLVVDASCDPTLGSDRWPGTSEQAIMQNIREAMKAKNSSNQPVGLTYRYRGYREPLVPEGWIWQDIGNYYGAGAHRFNWRENQFDVFFKTGTQVGDGVSVSGVSPLYLDSLYFNTDQLRTAAKGTGDNGYLFFDVWNRNSFRVSGTLPAGESRFSLSGAHPEPEQYFLQALKANGIAVHKQEMVATGTVQNLYSHQSPPLDSIMYWFLQKSINVYGEALIHTIAEKNTGSAAPGAEVLQGFWETRGIDRNSLHILDGSGLSPQNRVTSKALVTALMYARKQQWYNSFYRALPLINGQHMKSGSIEGSRAYAGYQQAADGTNYVFAIIVNNYSGSASQVTRKLWKVLDVLK